MSCIFWKAYRCCRHRHCYTSWATSFAERKEHLQTSIQPRIHSLPTPLDCFAGYGAKPRIETAFRPLSLKKGTILFRQGDRLKHIYQVVSGWMKLSRSSLKGQDLIVELLFAGDYFDLHTLLDGTPTSFTAASLSAHPVDLHCLREGCQSNPGLVRILHQQLAQQMRRQHDMMAALASESVEQRVILVLELLARRAGRQEGSSVVLPMPLSRKELAELTGSSVESSIRTLTDLQRRGLIRWNGQEFCCSQDFLNSARC